MIKRMSDEDLTTIIERALRRRLKREIERLTAERDAAFRAGAEAMREACLLAVKNEELEGPHDNSDDIAYDTALDHVAAAIRALPLPAHQSSTQTGTNATTGHS